MVEEGGSETHLRTFGVALAGRSGFSAACSPPLSLLKGAERVKVGRRRRLHSTSVRGASDVVVMGGTDRHWAIMHTNRGGNGSTLLSLFPHRVLQELSTATQKSGIEIIDIPFFRRNPAVRPKVKCSMTPVNNGVVAISERRRT